MLKILSNRLINQAKEQNPKDKINFNEAYVNDKNLVETSQKVSKLENENTQLNKKLNEKGNNF